MKKKYVQVQYNTIQYMTVIYGQQRKKKKKL